MPTLIHVGNVACSATGNGGLGVVSLGPTFDPSLPASIPIPDGLVSTNMPEYGAFFTRAPAQLTDGVPNRIAAYACHTLSLVDFGKHFGSTGINDPLDVMMSSDARWIAGEGSWAVGAADDNGNSIATWGNAVGFGAGTLQFAIDAGEKAANPATGILIDPASQYWARTGQVTTPVVVDDQNPCLLTPGQQPIQKMTVMLVATPYETNWSFGDLMAFYDPTQYDPTQAKLGCIRMVADELQLWIRGQQYTQRVVNPWAISADTGQQLIGRRPVVVGWSIDASVEAEDTQTGKGSLVVLDPYSSSGVDYTFYNRPTDKPFGSFLRIGQPGCVLLEPNPFNPLVIDQLMRLDIYELNLWQEALELDDLLAQASKLDSIYGIVQ